VRADSVMDITPHWSFRYPSLGVAELLSKTISAHPIPCGYRVWMDLRTLRYFVAVAEEPGLYNLLGRGLRYQCSFIAS
jgi:hypothetical protein